MNQLPFLDSDSFTNPQSSELKAFLKCIKDAEGENDQNVYRFLLIAPFSDCEINLPNIEVTLASDVTDKKCCLNGVAFDAVLYIGDNITFSDSVINDLKKICTNNAQHTPLFVACQIEKSEWLRLSKEFVCVDHIRYSKGTKALPYLTIACFPDYEIATEYGVTHDFHCHKLINVGVRTIADQIQRLYNIALHPLPTTITFYEGSNEVRNANPWIVKQAHYRNIDCSSLQSIFLTLAGLAQRLPEYKPIYTWLTSPEMQNVKSADSFEIFVSKSKEGEVNVSSKEIGIPEEVINEKIANVSDLDADVVDKEGSVVAGEFGSSGNASSLDESKIKFVKKWHEAFWNDFKQKSEKYKNFFDEAWRFYVSIMQGGQKISEENFKYFIFSRAYILGKNSESRLLFFPYWSEVQQRPLFAALMIYQSYSKAKHDFLLDLLERTAYNLENLYIISLKELESIKSAIGSIMSRNGSHNIGSHVLAALSHNVGTLPDDRVLYQYIQQRMDYIATVTTDFPTWTQPTMFVADMMKTFLSQRHLLDHIVESEGLYAFQFQNPNMTDEEWADQKNCVKIHIRKVDGKEKKDFIEYEKGKRETEIDLTNDVALAIPGGIIGEHAFYTILENVIRNAAKHSWATGNNNAKNLDVYIDLTDEDEKVKFNVYASLEASDCSELVDDLGQKLSQSFIDEDTGALRRENWGLAEMKISAGYLDGASIEAIGGIGDKKGTNEIIKPYVESSKYLGYEFFIAKPKEILIIVENKDAWNDKDGVMKKSGIFVKTNKEAKEELKLNYRYIVHYDATEFFDIETREPKDGILIPFRMLSAKKVPENKKDENEKISDWSWLQPYVADLDNGKCVGNGSGDSDKSESGFDQLQAAFNCGNVKSVRKIVYKVYYEHLRKSRNDFWSKCDNRKNKDDIKEIGLLVAVHENEKAGGNSLISDADILELMLEQNFAVCVDQYKAFAANEDNRKIIKCLESIRHKSSAKDKVIRFKHFSNKTIRELIAQRMCDWAGKLTEKPKDSWIPIVEHLRKKYFVSEIDDKTSIEFKPSSKKASDDFAASVNSLLQKHPIDDFIRYVESIFENTKKLFKQYEEQIVTLPSGYKINTASEVKQGDEASDIEVTLEGVKIVTNIEDIKNNKDSHWIGYRRHAHTIDGCKSLYVEPLSGTQTYLSQLTKVKDNLGLQMRLIENGLMRILVLDERVAKFLREHQKEVGPHYKAMNINVIDHEWVVVDGETPPEGFYEKFTSKHKEALKSFVKPQESNKSGDGQNGSTGENSDSSLTQLDDVDILIVHQGILDKWYPEFKNPNDMSKLLEGLKKLVKYVVVTTGRGTPENIPEEAHLLPFAVVESTLFKKYPEKLILTDTIMNVLPVGKKNDNSGGQE